MMKANIWMPLYIGDYLADTSRLTTEQHGAYLLLIMDYWRSGRLPDDDVVLAQICRLSPDAWRNARAMLMHYFCIEGGFWIHARVEAEKESALENKDKKTEQARKAAAARWSKDKNNAVSNAQAMPEQCPSPSPSPSHIKDIKIKERATKVANSRSTKMDIDWQLPDEWAIWAKQERPDLIVNKVAEQFKDHWLGNGNAKANWLATWRNWVRKERANTQDKVYEAPWQKAARLRMAEFAPNVAAKDPNQENVIDMDFFNKPQEIKNVTYNTGD